MTLVKRPELKAAAGFSTSGWQDVTMAVQDALTPGD